MLSDEQKTLVSTLENQKESSCENSSVEKEEKNIKHLSKVMTFSMKRNGGKWTGVTILHILK